MEGRVLQDVHGLVTRTTTRMGRAVVLVVRAARVDYTTVDVEEGIV